MTDRKRLGDILIDSGDITSDQLQDAIQYQKEHFLKLGEALVKLNYVTKEQIAKTLSIQFKLPLIDLMDTNVDRSVAKLIPQNVAKKYNVMPFGMEDGVVCMAISNPFDLHAIDDVHFITKKSIKPFISDEDSINWAIDKYYVDESSQKAIEELKKEFSIQSFDDQLDEGDEITNAPTVRLVKSIINQAIDLSASDIHIEPFESEVYVRVRVDGVLTKIMNIPKTSYSGVLTRFKILAEINIAEQRVPQDGRIETEIDGRAYDIRVSTLPTVFGEKLVLRILNRGNQLLDRSKLGFTKHEDGLIDKFQRSPYGIVLISGPTGSGKTTTLYTLLKEQNDVSQNVVTVEDPVEYMFDGINQVQVNTKAGLTFARGLRSILRQDPDVIMIGEIRDEETAEIAVRSAITGHMVLSTIHTNDAATSITRLVDMGIPAFLVAEGLVGVIAQRLMRTLCPHCKRPYDAKPFEMEVLGVEPGTKLFSARGCTRCNDTGYQGRIAIHEVLEITETLKKAIITGQSSEEIKNIAVESGMATLFANAKDVVLRGDSSFDEMTKTVFV
ncbi:GspE/PulE family protein [Fusibacter paucivorans]|uniref:GspE/PulE family protein n=1 Tax=Fusibacter paucivorans TaxID=76009 RepID=UPI001FE77E5D|nr:type II/IV secretion system protein [Fusibacter paucivorans]